MDKEKLYGVMLEDYALPRYMARTKLYLGTRNEFLDMVERLEGVEELNPYFGELCNGIRAYPSNPEARHTVVGKRYPVMIPVKEICRREITLTDHMWIHKPSYSSNAYLLNAKSIWLTYVLVECKDRLILAYKASFDCLAVSQPGIGWLCLANDLRGFPGTSYFEHYGDEESSLTHFTLYIEEKLYPAGTDVEEAKKSMPGMMDVDLSTIISAIAGTVLS